MISYVKGRRDFGSRLLADLTPDPALHMSPLAAPAGVLPARSLPNCKRCPDYDACRISAAHRGFFARPECEAAISEPEDAPPAEKPTEIIRRTNSGVILAALRASGPTGAPELAAATGLHAITVRAHLRRLVAEGHARVYGVERRSHMAPKTLYVAGGCEEQEHDRRW